MKTKTARKQDYLSKTCDGASFSDSTGSALKARTPAEAINLLERVQMEYMELDEELKKGKGDWTSAMKSNRRERYIQDDTWEAWRYAHTMLESMLRNFDPDFLSRTKEMYHE